MSRKISVEIVGDASSLNKAFAKASKGSKQFQGDMTKTNRVGKSAFGGLGRAAGFATGAIGVAGLTGAARVAFGEFSEGQKVMAQTNAVIKSTGKAAHVSAKHVEQLSDSMLKKTGIDDEATQSAINWLLSFRGIKNQVGKGNKIVDRATQAVADLATAQSDGAVPSQEAMVQSAKLVGKALDDPIRGLTALRRAGIGFTEEQKDRIKAMVKHNNVLGAQKLIIDEVTKQTGGRAVAAGKTFAGQMAIVRNTVLNLSATLVAKLMPSIQKLLGQLTRWLNNSKNQKAVLDTVSQAASALGSIISALSTAFGWLNKVTGSTKNTLILLTAVFATFKALKLVAYIAGITKAMRGLAVATAAANAAGAGGMGGFGQPGRGKKAGRFGFLKKLPIVAHPAVQAGIVASAITAKMAAPYVRDWRHAKRSPNAPLPRGQQRFPIPRLQAAGMNVQNQTNHFHGIQNPKQMEEALTKRHRGRAQRRRGAR